MCDARIAGRKAFASEWLREVVSQMGGGTGGSRVRKAGRKNRHLFAAHRVGKLKTALRKKKDKKGSKET